MPPSTVTGVDPEQARLAALRSYAVLDTGPEREFDELVQRAVRECGYATAALSLMDAQRCWFKALAGEAAADRNLRELPREQTFCNHAFRSSGIFVVRDARADERFRSLKGVDRVDGYRAYAGAQLITPDGYSVGTLCVLDRTAREPTSEQRATLRRLATEAMALLEARRCRNEAPAPPVAVAVPAPPKRRTVLVVDDESAVLYFVGCVLQSRGVPVLRAEDGAQGIAAYRANAESVGLVLTDVNMPVMDGFALIRALQAEPNPPEIAVMSGRLEPRMRAELAALGVAHVLAKPFTLEAIDRVIAGVRS